MPAYRLAIFDFDGTLADTYECFLALSDESADRFGYRRLDRDNMDALRRMSARELMAHQKAPMWKLPFIAAHAHKRMAAQLSEVRLFMGVDAMLADLHGRGVTLALVSSNSEANVRQILGRNAALFTRMECGASMFGKAAKFKKLMAQLKVLPDQTISIGDEIRDIEAARKVGIAAGAVAWGYNLLDALQARAPDRTFHHVEDIATQIG
ncbi:HAD hydrolase-like protein [Caulobacter sp. NIBR2454]|uniref:HAD hydrolase-like protein n=1 Tax=Caulobacter sp. NIBR2454 TaxID=3015996 RepID=UPI0022B6E8E0|nr:HAD hydrolase-like protein [Caulobacter sp. NIBR2454]